VIDSEYKKQKREIHWVGLPRKADAADRIHKKREERSTKQKQNHKLTSTNVGRR